MSHRVIVVGSVNVDLTVTTARLPRPGETVTGGTLAEHDGGKGGNQAVAAARLGARVAFVGAVGDDGLLFTVIVFGLGVGPNSPFKQGLGGRSAGRKQRHLLGASPAAPAQSPDCDGKAQPGHIATPPAIHIGPYGIKGPVHLSCALSK